MQDEHHLETEKSLNTTQAIEIERASETHIPTSSEGYSEALLKDPPPLWNSTTILLWLCTSVGFFCQTMNGFDGSLFGGLLANTVFLNHFHGANDGVWAGIVSAMYQIGGVAALPFIGPCIDTLGRRAGMFVGSILIILETVVSGLRIANASVHQFMGGRFLLGFRVAIASAAGPIYVVETTHPAYRGVATAYCNTFWFIGSILASGAVRGAITLSGNSSWQVPVWLQLCFSGLIALFAFLIPESPRWLYVHGKKEKALAYACFQFFFALIGAALVERVGRRPLMLFAMTSCVFAWIAIATSAGIHSSSTGVENVNSSKAAVAFIFIFGAVYSTGITPLQALYPVEVLSYEMRAKGMAFCNLATNAGGLINQFVWPISLKNIDWKTYIVFIAWDTVQAFIMYFFFPETKRRTLEEMDEIFSTKNPVKTSLAVFPATVDDEENKTGKI